MKTLAGLGADLETPNKVYGDTPLISTVYYGYREVAEFLLAQGVKVNARDKNGDTALYWADWVNYRHIVSLLTENGAKM